MYRHVTVALFLAFAFQQSYGTNVTIHDKDGQICLYANLMVNLSVSYPHDEKTNLTRSFMLPNNVTIEEDTCKENTSMLKIHFGKGHSWSMNFQKKEKTYQAESIVFVYSLSDSEYFPNSQSNGTLKATVKPKITDVGLDTNYLCKSKETLAAAWVKQTLWNVHIQAFVSNGTLSAKHTVCAADKSATTTASTQHTAPTNTTTPAPTNTTTPAPTNTTTPAPTNTTTPAPTTTTTPAPTNTTTPAPTNTTTPAPTPTTTPAPTLPTPTTGDYTVKDIVKNLTCLLASFGLRVGVKQGDKYEELNLNPNATTGSGSCGEDSSQLLLTSGTLNITFTFTNDTKKFRLHGFSATGKTGSGILFTEGNNNLSLWEASLSSSYMCNKEQNFSINSNLTLFTFNLHVQPFGVNKGQFSTAEDCQAGGTDSYIVPIAVGIALLVLILMVVLAYFIGRKRNMAAAEECFLDTDLNFLVPIAVGVALSFLIILVLISYLIGRRKSRTGYQSV